ncbi:RIO1 family regulatory kinase/ATPase [Paenibacillus terrigena]|uniref:RIO1 family regulatory kinase/ATPase domain-containing protein n=1 Tax=Paenibacillus terrigena TaxID=369333 RepID=UPI0028D5406A|nr:RIO1 family regulatory kinase/ATPase [Paenibacillus terrigena]
MDKQHLPADAVLIGRGKQGMVYQISADRCIKFYKNKEHARMEYTAYRLAEGSPIIPKLYEYGEDYLVLEFINGYSLKRTLETTKTISRAESEQILYIIHEMKRLGFTRIDIALFHIYIQEHTCKIIDLVNSYNKEYPVPKVMLKSLAKLGLLGPFMTHIKDLDSDLYLIWLDHIATRSDRYGDVFAN